MVEAKDKDNFGLDKEIVLDGKYTLAKPRYTNENTLDKLFSDTQKAKIKSVLGSEIYEKYFVYGLKNGEYTYDRLNSKDDIVKGELYTVTVPTMEKDFKLLISRENIYFYAKQEKIYKTDDENRKQIGKMPAAIVFDEL